MHIGSILTKAKQQLRDAGVESFALDADLLMAHMLDKDRSYVIGHVDDALSEAQGQHFESLLSRRLQREPMSHILGKREFWGRDFIVTPDTLDPRPDSETLIEAVLEQYPDKHLPYRILDLGTGCLLLTLLCEYSQASGVGVDISAGALDVALRNASALGVAEHVAWHGNGWQDFVPDAPFDIIISNPPYIPLADKPTLAPEVVEYEPHTALFAGDDGLDCYRDLCTRIPHWLTADGGVLFEHGIGQEQAIGALAEQSGFKVVKRYADLAGTSRVVSLRMHS